MSTASTLFTPLTIRGSRIRNRIWATPMCQYAIDARDGVPGDWHLAHLGGFARGGAGVVMAEATAIEPDGRISPFDTGLWNDAQVHAWQRVTSFIRAQGAISGIQLAHAGAKASTARPWDTGERRISAEDGGWDTVGPSAGERAADRALTVTEIGSIVELYRDAAARAIAAGFDIVEIHAAHGYLIHQFLSGAVNDRDDEYGGSLENRARLLREVVGAVRGVIGDDIALFVRLSAVDYIDGGIDIGQTCEFAAMARDAGADLFDISSGGLQQTRVPVHPGYQVPYARAVRDSTGALVSAVGLITDPLHAERIVETHDADAVMIGRELLRDPHFAARAAAALGVRPTWPDNYARARWTVHESGDPA